MKRGTKITTLNASGSQLDFDWVLENTEDHVVLIQEHWSLPKQNQVLEISGFPKRLDWSLALF
eukprot:6748325-Heterocapsa_arctica.AAC.1